MNECINFWNREGFHIYISNLEGTLGTKENNEEAKNTPFSSWILEMILCDAKTYAKPNFEETKKLSLVKDGKKLEAGRTSSHVWIHEDDERVMMIHVN